MKKDKFKAVVTGDGQFWYVRLMTYEMNRMWFGPFKSRKDARFVKKDLEMAVESANELAVI